MRKRLPAVTGDQETLAHLREAAGKTTREVGAFLGVSQPRITQIEKRGTADVRQIQMLALFYGVPFERVLAANARILPRKLDKKSLSNA